MPDEPPTDRVTALLAIIDLFANAGVSMSVVTWAPQSWWEAQSDQALAAIQASPFYSDDDKALASKEWSRRVKAKLAERSCAP